MERFGEKLRALRKRNGMTMKELADMLDFASHGFVSDLERGRRMPSAMLVVKIAHLFNVTADELMFDELDLKG